MSPIIIVHCPRCGKPFMASVGVGQTEADLDVPPCLKCERELAQEREEQTMEDEYESESE